MIKLLYLVTRIPLRTLKGDDGRGDKSSLVGVYFLEAARHPLLSPD